MDTLGYHTFERLSVSCYGNGTYLQSSWQGASLIRALQGISDPCDCAQVCHAKIVEARCRCWDFTNHTGECRLYNYCSVSWNRTSDLPINLNQQEPGFGWCAGELNGLF